MKGIKVTTIRPRPRAVQYEPRTTAYSRLSQEDKHAFDEAISTPDPYAVLRAKTLHLAELLDCTEAEAERIILERLGSTD
ncbi:hypothetical protein QTI66_32780 [Variovorax sp. J22R133]|uniref:hypothetical protein n=1 Tax=Variovorax brevis TaxID=3053503 RepID=UPI0025775DFE|nr:hypothetical protein [Variovorax sp. J22R133]MDM0116904.1 hypothetical protein [Variovorax sp. J22R133]